MKPTKRIGSIAIVSLALLALVAPGASAQRAAPGHASGPVAQSDHRRDDFGRHRHRHGRRDDTMRLTAAAGPAVEGRAMALTAQVDAGRRGCATTILVDATVNFQTGSVYVDLVQVSAGSTQYTASVSVAGEEPTGPITVDVTATCADRSVTVTVATEVVIDTGPGH